MFHCLRLDHPLLPAGCQNPWRIHGAAIYGNMDPINIPPMGSHIYQHHGSVMGNRLSMTISNGMWIFMWFPASQMGAEMKAYFNYSQVHRTLVSFGCEMATPIASYGFPNAPSWLNTLELQAFWMFVEGAFNLGHAWVQNMGDWCAISGTLYFRGVWNVPNSKPQALPLETQARTLGNSTDKNLQCSLCSLY